MPRVLLQAVAELEPLLLELLDLALEVGDGGHLLVDPLVVALVVIGQRGLDREAITAALVDGAWSPPTLRPAESSAPDCR